jgi:hypothetical protein
MESNRTSVFMENPPLMHPRSTQVEIDGHQGTLLGLPPCLRLDCEEPEYAAPRTPSVSESCLWLGSAQCQIPGDWGFAG